MCSDLPKVAVLLAAYNGTSWLEEQLNSILLQTGVSVSVFISVDTSSDNTEAWCIKYVQHHANTVLLPLTGPFGGAALNFFRLIRDVDFSGFDYVAFSDQDDIWHLDKLSRAVWKLRAGKYDAYSSNVIAFWPDGRRMLLDKAQPQVRWDYLFEAAGPGCTYVMTRPLADAFKASLRERWNLAQRISLHDWYCYAFARGSGFAWYIDPTPSVDYRQHSHNQVGANTGILSYTTRLINIMNSWWPEQVLLISQLTGNNPIPARRGKVAKRLFFLMLIPLAAQCRRRPRDKVFFVIACLLAAFR